MILKLLWIKWNIQKTYFWCYFWINIIFKIIFVSLFWVHPCLIQKNLIPFPPKNSSPASENFPFPPKIPKILSHPQCRVGKTLCVHFLIISIGVVYPMNSARVLYFFEIGQAGGSDKTLESWRGWPSWWKTFSGEVEHI